MLHHTVEGPVADNRIFSFPQTCCCWRGTCHVGLRQRGGRLRGWGPGESCSWPCGVEQRSCVGDGPLPRAGAQLPVDCVLFLRGVAGAAAGRQHMPRSRWRPAIRGPPSSESTSTSGLSRLVLPRRLWRVVGWVGFLLDVISGVESALWEGCYPALTLAPTCEANRAS